MKKILLLTTIFLGVFAIAYPQDNQIVTLTVTSQGKTQDEAKQNALRNAIEQAFGAFISSNTEILNDELVKDEIVSVSNGNIQEFEIISEVQIPDGDFATTLKATVSVSKLTSFVESKGEKVEFKGGLFAANIINQELMEKSEISCLINISNILGEISNNSFDFQVEISQPQVNANKEINYYIPVEVRCMGNSNLEKWSDLFYNSLKALSLQPHEIKNYSDINKEVFPLKVIQRKNNNNKKSKTEILYFRSEKSLLAITLIQNHLLFGLQNFVVQNNIKNTTLMDLIECNPYEEIGCLRQTASNYLMNSFGQIILGRFGPGSDRCYTCIYGKDSFFITYRSANFNAWLLNTISFFDLRNLVNENVAIYKYENQYSLQDLKLITEYIVSKNDEYIKPILSLDWHKESGHGKGYERD